MARAPDPNLRLLIAVAQALGELRERFVFVGGCATGLLITDPAAPAVRPTGDVDVIVEAGALLEYRQIGRALEAKGFSQPLAIRLVTAPYFIATKYEAFIGRGRGDYLASHDFEDLMAVIDGRPELEAELSAASARLRKHIAGVIGRTIADDRFRAVVGGFVIEQGGSPDRASVLMARMRRLAGLADGT